MRSLSLPPAEVRIFPDAAFLSRAVADEFHRCANAAIDHAGFFSVALSGGSTPKAVYSLLAADENSGRARLRWHLIHVFFGDERSVPPEHAESNFRMANEALLAGVPIPASNVHRVHSELEPDAAAGHYEAEIRRILACSPDEVPRFDLILLGLGGDGHTASLFPESSALNERKALVCSTWVEKLGTHRITFSFPVLNAAREILFIAAGGEKAGMLRNILGGDPSGINYPAQGVRLTSGQLLWFVDEEAASEL